MVPWCHGLIRVIRWPSRPVGPHKILIIRMDTMVPWYHLVLRSYNISNYNLQSEKYIHSLAEIIGQSRKIQNGKIGKKDFFNISYSWGWLRIWKMSHRFVMISSKISNYNLLTENFICLWRILSLSREKFKLKK